MPARAFGWIFLGLLWVLSPPDAGAAFDSANQSEEGALEVRRIVPSGEDVPVGRQIVIEFDRPVVPIGRMARDADELPITVYPALQCQWRWLNTSSLACQLDEDNQLVASTRYTLEIGTTLTTESGIGLAAPLRHEFITQRADVRWPNFRTWRSPGYPVIRLVFNQPVEAASVAAHLFFQPKQEPSARTAIEVLPDTTTPDYPRVISLPGEKDLALLSEPPAKSSAPDSTEPANTWLIVPVHELPLDTSVHLMIEPGVVSGLGPEPSAKERVVVEFDTFPELAFVGVECLDNESDAWVVISVDVAYEAQARCDPMRGVGVVFSAPVLPQSVKDHMVLTPDLAGGRKDYDPWANRLGHSRLKRPHRKGNTYRVWFPERLLAHQQYRLWSLAGSVQDEFARTLATPIDLYFMTSHRRPKLTLVHAKAVLEKGVDSKVPLFVTNLDRIQIDFSRLTMVEASTRLRRQLIVPEVEDLAFKIPFRVRDMLKGRSGALSGRVRGEPQHPRDPQSLSFFAQVTPFQVHFKLGHFNSVAWVTDLESGEPIRDATLSLYPSTYQALADEPARSFGPFTTDASGIAELPGLEEIDPRLRLISQWHDEEPRWFLRVDKDDDLALLPLDRHFRIWSYGVWPQVRKQFGHLKTWGTTAQGVYRAGDTIQYKIYVRNQDNRRLVTPPHDGYTLSIIDPQGRVMHKRTDIALSAFGAFAGDLVIPEDAPIGWYRFSLAADFFTDHAWQPLRVLVSEFTPSPFRVSTDLNGDVFGPEDEIVVTTTGRLHSGGPYTDAQTRITARLRARPFRPEHPVAKRFFFNTDFNRDRSWKQVHQSTRNLSDAGELETRFSLSDAAIQFATLQVESSVRDDRGKYIASLKSARYVARDRFVGLRNTRWLHKEDEPAQVEFLVADLDGNPVAGVPVAIAIERQVVHATRVKGAGNAYLTQYDKKWEAVSECLGHSSELPETCEYLPQEPGAFRIRAEIQDTQGRQQSAEIRAWVRGKGQVLWEQANNNQLTLIPENERLEVGDTARYLIRNPFPGALALITLERYGVMKRWVQRLETATPVLEFEVTPDHVPGVYLSVVVTSPRVAAPLDSDGVDLGKPAFRMGYVKVPVDDPYKQIEVAVTPSGSTFKPRDPVRVEVQARPRRGTSDAPVELAVAVLDEAVFDLIQGGTRYYDPYAGFYKLESLDLLNYGLLTRLVGRQKIEKKGANPGGDGGPGLGLRSLFKFVSYWNPSITTDAEGKASFDFVVPDNLTGWRILVLAATPEDRLGLGQASIQVNRPTELRPVMPNQVTEGDVFDAGFSVMNRTDSARRIAVKVSAMDAAGTTTEDAFELEIGPYKRTTVWLPINADAPGEITFAASAGDSADSDRLSHSVPVRKRRSLETAASYGSTEADEVSETLEVPQNIHGDVGAFGLVVSPSVIGNISGAFKYLRDYPYNCWEQQLSRGVMASHYGNLRAYLPAALDWASAETLPQATLDRAHRYQADNGGMTYWIAENDYVSPYLSAYTALAFNWLRRSGYSIPQPVEAALHQYLERLLRDDIMPTFYSRGMSSTVRAVALAALAEHGKVSTDHLARYEDHFPYMSLFGKAHFLEAARQVPGADRYLAALVDGIMAHASVSGGKFQLNETVDDGYQRLLATPLRANCAVLSGLVALGEQAETKAMVGDVPYKLVRAVTQTRGNRDHWENTQENVFCMNALIEFSKAYEKTAPDMVVTGRIDGEPFGQAHFDDRRDEAQNFERELEPIDVGKTRTVEIERRGTGRLYYATRLTFAPVADYALRVNAGVDIRREYSVQREGEWVVLKSRMRIARGELVRVDLFVSVPTARQFVVVDDPVPGGLEPVNRDLATASTVDADAGRYQASGGSWWFAFDDWQRYGVSRWSFYHQELRHDSARFFSDYLPAGNYHLSYTAQAIAAGRFTVMPVHAEEMYDPDVFGKGLAGELEVGD